MDRGIHHCLRFPMTSFCWNKTRLVIRGSQSHRDPDARKSKRQKSKQSRVATARTSKTIWMLIFHFGVVTERVNKSLSKKRRCGHRDFFSSLATNRTTHGPWLIRGVDGKTTCFCSDKMKHALASCPDFAFMNKRWATEWADAAAAHGESSHAPVEQVHLSPEDATVAHADLQPQHCV